MLITSWVRKRIPYKHVFAPKCMYSMCTRPNSGFLEGNRSNCDIVPKHNCFKCFSFHPMMIELPHAQFFSAKIVWYISGKFWSVWKFRKVMQTFRNFYFMSAHCLRWWHVWVVECEWCGHCGLILGQFWPALAQHRPATKCWLGDGLYT